MKTYPDRLSSGFNMVKWAYVYNNTLSTIIFGSYLPHNDVLNIYIDSYTAYSTLQSAVIGASPGGCGGDVLVPWHGASVYLPDMGLVPIFRQIYDKYTYGMKVVYPSTVSLPNYNTAKLAVKRDYDETIFISVANDVLYGIKYYMDCGIKDATMPLSEFIYTMYGSTIPEVRP